MKNPVNFIYCAVLVLSNILSANAALKNNPIGDKDGVLFATTFSLADNDEQTEYENFRLSDVYSYGQGGISINQDYDETNNAEFNEYNNIRQYAILSNPSFLQKSQYVIPAYPSITDEKNRIVINTIGSSEELFNLFDIRIPNCKVGTAIQIEFDLEWVHSSGDAWYGLFINNASSGIRYYNLKEDKNYYHVNESVVADKEEMLFHFIKTDGSNMAIAVSNIKVSGEQSVLSISSYSADSFLGTPVTLTAYMPSGDERGLTWYESIDNQLTWKEIAYGTKTLITTPDHVGTVFYKASLVLPDQTVVESNIEYVARMIKCGEKSKVMFFDDFGTLNGEKDRARSEWVDRLSTFTYIDRCQQIRGNEHNDYAIVANPAWGGCGSYEDGKCCECGEDATWYYAKFDHTQGSPVNHVYGGMLIMNPLDRQGSEGIMVYSRPIETICRNTFVNFSVWFANPSKNSADPVSAELRVRDANGHYIPEATIAIKDILPNRPWQQAITSFNTGDNESLTVEIWNLTDGSNVGNDLLIDDILVVACPPVGTLNVEAEPEHYYITADQVYGPCGGSVTMTVTGNTIKTMFPNPYFLWVCKSADEADYSIHKSFDGSDSQIVTLGGDSLYKVIVAGSYEDAVRYFNGEGESAGCVLASETNTYRSYCVPVTSNYERSCNTVSFTASRASVWYKLNSQTQQWEVIGSDEPSVTAVAEIDDKYRCFKAVAYDTGDETDPLCFNKSTLDIIGKAESEADFKTDVVLISKGENVILSARSAEIEGVLNYYSEDGTLVGSATVDEPEVLIQGVESATKFYVTGGGCESQSRIAVYVRPVITEASRICNTVSLTSTQSVFWVVKTQSQTTTSSTASTEFVYEMNFADGEHNFTAYAVQDNVNIPTLETITELPYADIDIKAYVNNETTVIFSGGDVVEIEAGESVTIYPDNLEYNVSYTVYAEDTNGQRVVGVINVQPGEVITALSDIPTQNTNYTIERGGCYSEPIIVNVEGGVFVSIKEREGCNTVTLIAETELPEVTWYKAIDPFLGWEGPLTDGSGTVITSKEIEQTIESNIYYKAEVTYRSQSGAVRIVSSRPQQVEFYQVELLANIKEQTEKYNNHIYVNVGSDIELTLNPRSYAGTGAEYSFLNGAGTQIGIVPQELVATGVVPVENVLENDVYTVHVRNCVSNTVTLIVQDTVNIPEPDPETGVTPVVRRNCNDITITAESSTDNVYWFSSTDGDQWTAVEDGAVIGKILNITLAETSPLIYRAGVKIMTPDGEGWNYSRAVEVEYYQMELLAALKGSQQKVNDKLYVDMGSDIELSMNPDSYAGADAVYVFKNNAGSEVGSLTQAEIQSGVVSVENILENNMFTVSVLECVSNSVAVLVQDTVSIPEPDPEAGVTPVVRRNCNDITITAESSTDNVYWFSSSNGTDWTDVQGGAVVGKTLNVTLETSDTDRYYRAGVKIMTPDGEGWNYSRAVEVEFYQMELLAALKGTQQKFNDKLYVDMGSDIELSMNPDSYAGADAVYVFKNNTGTEVGSLTQAEIQSGVVGVESILENNMFTVSVLECISNSVEVLVQDTVNIPDPDPETGVTPVVRHNCNDITITAESSTNYVYWFSSNDGENWTMVMCPCGSAEVGKVLEFTMEENLDRYYKAGVRIQTPDGEDWNYSRIVEVEYYSVTLTVSPGTVVDYNSDITLTVTPESYIGADAEFIFYRNNGEEIGRVSAQSADRSIKITGVTEDAKYYVMAGECSSNEVDVVVNGSVELFSKRECNSAEISAVVAGRGDVNWYKQASGGEWELMPEKGNKINIDVTEDIKIKAAIGTFESNIIELDFYSVELIATDLSSGMSGSNIDVVIGAIVRLTPVTTGMYDINEYIYYDESGKIISVKKADEPELECNPSIDKGYNVTVFGCESGSATVKVEWPTIFTPYELDGYNDDFVKDVEPAIAVKVFDRTGNMMADSPNGWDGTVKDGNLAMPGVYYYVATMSDGTIRRSTVEVYKK